MKHSAKRFLALLISALLVGSLTACQTGVTTTSGAEVSVVSATETGSKAASDSLSEEKKPVTDGTQTITTIGNGLKGKMNLQVTFSANKISDIQVLENNETPDILESATTTLLPRIIQSQSLAVDSITGATVSSMAIKSGIATAIDQAGGDSQQWYTEIAQKTDTVKLEGYDVIVVGLGGAGMTSYLSAAQNGAKVFGIDSAAKVGGTTSQASGPMAINSKIKMDTENGGKKFLEEEDLINDWITYTQGDAKEDIVRLFVNQSGATLDWLMTDFGFEFNPMMAFVHPKGWIVWCAYKGIAATEYGATKTPIFEEAFQKAKAMNAKNDYMLELTAKELIVENGNITGVKATLYDGTTYEIYGKSVILATGGYIGNNEMMNEQFGTTYNTEAMLQDDGAGIKMAQVVGAATYNMNVPPVVHIAQTKMLIRNDDLDALGKAVLTSLVLKSDSMITDLSGKRFMSEAGMIAFDNWKVDGKYYSIYSQAQMDEYQAKGMAVVANPMFMGQGAVVEENTPITDMKNILEVGEKYGIVVKADTIEELATKLNAPNLAAQVAEYNSYKTTADPFGKDATLINPLEKGAFYAIAGAGYAYATCGGLDINETLNVLKTDKTPIANLYAVGQDSSGVLFTPKDAYVGYGGAAQGWAITSGRLAGKNAAESFK